MPALVRPNGLAVDPRDAFYVALALAQTQQGEDGCAFVRLQDVHSVTSTRGGRVHVPPNRCRRRRRYPLLPINSGGGVCSGQNRGSLGGHRGSTDALTANHMMQCIAKG